MNTWFALALALSSVTAMLFWQRQRVQRREAHIRHFNFPKGVFSKVIARHPQLTQRDMELVSQGLRQFFLAYHHSRYQYVSMPSQVADDLWHEFILYTRHYEAFCRQAFGRFLHHTPAVVLRQARLSNEGLRRTWHHACWEEHINPRKPSRLPLLFALDRKFGIANGFIYVADCSGVQREDLTRDGGATYCGGDFSDASVDGGTSGLDDGGNHDGHDNSHGHGHGGGHDSGGDGSGDGGGGDGGSSCGGGCGGD